MDKFYTYNYFGLISKISLEYVDSQEYKKILEILLNCYRNKGIVYTMGCGGSASTATHFAADLAKTVGGFRAISLVDNIPLVSAYTNDEGWGSIFRGQLQNWITRDDVLIGFSVHGGRKDWSQNLMGALHLAKERRSKIIGFSGFDGGALKEMSDACIVVSTESEVYGTPVVEAMHVVIHHGLIFDLKERLK